MAIVLSPQREPAEETPSLLERLLFDADKRLNVRLEMVGGLPVWEAWPVVRHQRTVDRIRATLRRAHQPQSDKEGDGGCECVHYADIYVRFPDGSLKRPDISIFCREPDEETSAVTLVPEAVIEILSEGYQAKDLEVGVPFYKRMGVSDIIVFDPDTNAILHYAGTLPPRKLISPVEITLACGCCCTV